jgi:hypothetical protein
MIDYLRKFFHESRAEEGYSLAISYGTEGARLSHDHSRQYSYALQSLLLWREVAHGTACLVAVTRCTASTCDRVFVACAADSCRWGCRHVQAVVLGGARPVVQHIAVSSRSPCSLAVSVNARCVFCPDRTLPRMTPLAARLLRGDVAGVLRCSFRYRLRDTGQGLNRIQDVRARCTCWVVVEGR